MLGGFAVAVISHSVLLVLFGSGSGLRARLLFRVRCNFKFVLARRFELMCRALHFVRVGRTVLSSTWAQKL